MIREFTARYPDKSLSMGIAWTGGSEFVSVDDLVRQADQAKRTPGSMICRFEELSAPEKND